MFETVRKEKRARYIILCYLDGTTVIYIMENKVNFPHRLVANEQQHAVL